MCEFKIVIKIHFKKNT